MWKWYDPDQNGKRFVEWEDGDTWESLAEFLKDEGVPRIYSPEDLSGFYSDAILGNGLIIDTSTIRSENIGGERGLEDTSLDLYLIFAPIGKGAKAAESSGLLTRILRGAGRLIGVGVEKEIAKTVTKRVAVKVVERAGDVIIWEAQTPNGPVQIIANVVKEGGRIILNKAHIEGPGAGTMGRKLLKEIVEQIGIDNGAKEVVINGGTRTTGKYVGKVPSQITVKINQ
jgi:hypothetical protein